MAEVMFLHEAGAASVAALRDGMYCLRHRVFKERLGWSVTSVEGREHDKYDDLRPVYLLCRNKHDEVEGCWRLLPTTGPYLLKDVFDDLLHGHPAPEDTQIWEISRFAIEPSRRNYRSLAAVHELTGRMFGRLFEFGLEHGIVRIVGVTDVLCERVLARTGVFIERFGPPKQIGRTLAVAGWLDVSQENLDRVRACFESRSTGHRPETAILSPESRRFKSSPHPESRAIHASDPTPLDATSRRLWCRGDRPNIAYGEGGRTAKE